MTSVLLNEFDLGPDGECSDDEVNALVITHQRATPIIIHWIALGSSCDAFLLASPSASNHPRPSDVSALYGKRLFDFGSRISILPSEPLQIFLRE